MSTSPRAAPKHYRATTYLSKIEDGALIEHLATSDNEASALRHLARLGFQVFQGELGVGSQATMTPDLQASLDQILANSNPDLIRQIVGAALTEALSQLEFSKPSTTTQPDHPEEDNLDAFLL